MTLREMTVDDLDQVMELEEDLFTPPWTREGYFTFLTRPDTLFVVVEEKGEILGYAGALLVLNEGDVLSVGVKRSRQREGIGHFLVESLILLAGEQGVHTLFLEVRQSNEEAIRLYERCGFVRNGIRKNYYTEPVENAVLMTGKFKFTD